jgi:ankyrin repeat protein
VEPLSEALSFVERGEVDELVRLLDRHVDHAGELLQVRSPVEQHTLLEAATHAGKLAVVDVLLRRGADVNLRNEHGLTPLHVAAFLGHDAVAERLMIAPNIKLDVRSGDGNTPLCLLVGRRQSVEDQKRTRKVLRILATRGADINYLNKQHDGPLHLAIRSNNLDHVHTLLSHGADVDLRSKHHHSDTPLCTAVRENHLEIARMLVEHGADFSIEGASGTPRQLARRLANADPQQKQRMLKLFRAKRAKKEVRVVYLETYTDIQARRSSGVAAPTHATAAAAHKDQAGPAPAASDPLPRVCGGGGGGGGGCCVFLDACWPARGGARRG